MVCIKCGDERLVSIKGDFIFKGNIGEFVFQEVKMFKCMTCDEKYYDTKVITDIETEVIENCKDNKMRRLGRLFKKGYNNIDEIIPSKTGKYEVIIHSGSISPSYYKTIRLFNNGRFPRMDWDYVLMWREIT